MIKEFSTFGSCASRMIFNSKINPNYNEFFHINESVEQVSLISLMTSPVDIDKKYIENSDNFCKSCVNHDLTKIFLEFLKKDKIDYLIIDTYFDVVINVIELNKNEYLSESVQLKKTMLHSLLNENNRINIQENYEKYFSLWKNACNLFFDFINDYCSRTKIILNLNRMVYKYYDDKLIINEEFKKLSETNRYRDILDKYILENFDVEVLPFDNSILLNKNHPYELHPSHYEPRYYLEKTQQLNKIIERNNLFHYDYKLNREIRATQRKNILLTL